MSVAFIGPVEPSNTPLPLFTCTIAAGFASPADDHIEATLSLDELCVRHPASTFFLRVSGDSMTGLGIFDGDVLVVDRSLSPQPGGRNRSNADIHQAAVGSRPTGNRKCVQCLRS